MVKQEPQVYLWRLTAVNTLLHSFISRSNRPLHWQVSVIANALCIESSPILAVPQWDLVLGLVPNAAVTMLRGNNFIFSDEMCKLLSYNAQRCSVIGRYRASQHLLQHSKRNIELSYNSACLLLTKQCSI